jgi:hypothetical protein
MRKKFFLLLFLFTYTLSAQQEKESIATEVINVVSSYTPSLSDAFKLKDAPEIDTNNSSKKKQFYRINSKRILSLFQPDAGAYQTPFGKNQSFTYPNYVKIGYGSYNTPLLEAFVTQKKKEHDFNFSLFNKASRGGIPDVHLDNNYINTKLGIGYKNQQDRHTWLANLNYQKDRYNWYGLASNIAFDQAVLESIEEKQSFRHLALGGALLLASGNLKKTDISFHYFSDKFDSQETQVHLQSIFEFRLGKNTLLTNFNIDILNGSFDNNFMGTEELNYGQLTFSAKATYPISKNGFDFSIGTQLLHNSDMEKNTQKFYVYPDIQIDYSFDENLLSIYAGANGGLTQNSYRDFAFRNPYISPSLNTSPTNRVYNIFTGVKGIISSKVSYHIKASLRKDNNKPLFQLNPNLSDGTNTLAEGYQYGNSFNVVYDEIRTFELSGEFRTELRDNLFVGASMSFRHYTTDLQESAWNLPNFDSNLFGSYQHKKWHHKVEILLMGKRKDLAIQSDLNAIIKELKGFADVSLSTQYQLQQNWSASFEIQNLFNQDYARFENFNVQGFQLLVGVRYQFDLKKQM